MDTYFDTYLTSRQEKTTFEPDIFLYTFSDLLNEYIKNKNCYACLTEPLCVCKPDECDCDHDEYFRVKQCTFDMGSNCNFTINVVLKEPLNQEKDKNLMRELEGCNVRIFCFDGDDSKNIGVEKERSLMYIMRSSDEELSYVKFHSPNSEMLFEIADNFSTKYASFTFRINYMNFKTAKEVEEKSKYSM